MFARKVTARLKTNSIQRFVNLLEAEILPWLRQQEGFQDLITLAAPDGTEISTISFWDHERDAQEYNASGYPEVLQMLEDLLDGVPYVKTFEVVSSTLDQLTTHSPQAENQSHKTALPQPSYQSYGTNA